MTDDPAQHDEGGDGRCSRAGAMPHPRRHGGRPPLPAGEHAIVGVGRASALAANPATRSSRQ